MMTSPMISPMQSATRGNCPSCNGQIAMHQNGTLRRHGPRNNGCPGSGGLPAAHLTSQETSNIRSSHQTEVTYRSGISCPVSACQEILAPSMIIRHLEQHLCGIFDGPIPIAWLRQNRKFICPCRRIVAESRRSLHLSRCSFSRQDTTTEEQESSHLSNDLPSIREVLCLFRPTLKHVPANAKQAWSRALQETLNKVILHNDIEHFTLLAMLPKCVLPSSKRSGRKHQNGVNIATLCDRWLAGEYVTLWNEACNNAKKIKVTYSTKSKDHDNDLELRENVRKAAIAFAEDGLFGKACRVLTSKGIAPNTSETRRLLVEKHPQHEPPTPPDFSSDSIPRLPQDFDIRAVLSSFPRGTACGPSGLRVDHITTACNSALPVSLVATLRSLINLMISGRACKEAAPFFAGASLTALLKSKESGPLDIRPIAVGEVLRRLIGKCLCKVFSSTVGRLFANTQFGVSCPGGVEKVVHRMRHIIHSHWEDEDFVILKIDMANAFNSVSRQCVLDECSKEIPELLPWVSWCYSQNPLLWHPTGMLSSANGVQQGDPLGPLLFALGLNRLVDSLKHIPGLTHNLWYLDDGILCGGIQSIKQCLCMIQESETWSGLHLNLHKCELYSKIDLSSFPSNVRKLGKPNMEILGSPIGEVSFCIDYVKKKRLEAAKLLRAIVHLKDPQISLNLLRICGGFCKLNHIARSCQSNQISEQLSEFDTDVMRCFEESLCIGLTEASRLQVELSMKRGGFGLRSVRKHASAAYISSISSTNSPHLDIQEVINDYNTRVKASDRLDDVNIPECRSQRSLSQRIEEAQEERLQQMMSSTAEKARLSAVSNTHSSSWLSAIPNPGLDQRLEPNEVHVLTKLRLGLPLNCKSTCLMCPDKQMDDFGIHGTTCMRGPDVNRRHNILRNKIYRFCQRARLNPKQEQGSSDDLQRPADILIPNWTLGQAAAIDITVVHPLIPNYIHGASTASDVCLAAAESRKHRGNDERCARLGWRCVPVAVTAYGVWGGEATAFLKQLGCTMAVQSNEKVSVVHREIFDCLGISLAKSVARAILARSTHIE